MKSHLSHACALFLAAALASCGDGGGQPPAPDQFVTTSTGEAIQSDGWQDETQAAIKITKAAKLTALFVGECDQPGKRMYLRIVYSQGGAEMTPVVSATCFAADEQTAHTMIPLLASTPKAVGPGLYVVRVQWTSLGGGPSPFSSSSLSVGPSQ